MAKNTWLPIARGGLPDQRLGLDARGCPCHPVEPEVTRTPEDVKTIAEVHELMDFLIARIGEDTEDRIGALFPNDGMPKGYAAAELAGSLRGENRNPLWWTSWGARKSSLRGLAVIYDDHPDFREEWQPPDFSGPEWRIVDDTATAEGKSPVPVGARTRPGTGRLRRWLRG